jgi:hypothetical protein
MTLCELIEAFRVDVDDLARTKNRNEKELLWTNRDLARWFTEAEAEAALRMRLLFDNFTTAVTEIEIEAGTSKYALDPRLFEVTAAYLYNIGETRRQRLTITDLPYLSEHCPYWRGDRSPPERIVVEDSYILLPNQITEPWLLRLEGFRTPLEKFSEDNESAEPEIAEIHHIRLVDWAKHRAYQKPDSETLNPGKSKEALADFEAYFGYRLTANQGKRNQADRPHHVRAYW